MSAPDRRQVSLGPGIPRFDLEPLDLPLAPPAPVACCGVGQIGAAEADHGGDDAPLWDDAEILTALSAPDGSSAGARNEAARRAREVAARKVAARVRRKKRNRARDGGKWMQS